MKTSFSTYSLRRLLLRPSFYVCLVSIIAYCDWDALHGDFVYDDSACIARNPVVTGRLPLAQVWTRDYWGKPLSDVSSHKSFRPITTLTFRFNWLLSERLGMSTTTASRTFGFHLVNVGLHGIVSALVTEAAGFVFDGTITTSSSIAPLVTGFCFGLHPIHAEAVSNLTSRGELLMSLFFLLGFLVYARALQGTQSFWSISVAPCICMILSMLSKEQGATTLMSLVLYDFLQHFGSLYHFFHSLYEKKVEAIAFCRRALLFTVQTVVVLLARYLWNGDSPPDVVQDQNPAALAENRLTRILSVNWVYCLYIRDILYPQYLAPDWSGDSIPLVYTWSDPRVMGVLLLWLLATLLLISLVTGGPLFHCRKSLLVAVCCFTLMPFLLSSNLLVVVGLMKADRIMYLPLMGFCLLEGLLVQQLTFPAATKTTSATRGHSSKLNQPSFSLRSSPVLWLVLIQLGLFAAKLHERNLAWSSGLSLWLSAYQVNPRSLHTRLNLAGQLQIHQRWAEAELVFRPLADPNVDGPDRTYFYAVILYHLERCDEVHQYIDKALKVVEDHQSKGLDMLRASQMSLSRTESDLYVIQAYCTQDHNRTEARRLLELAHVADPTNMQATQEATKRIRKQELEEQLRELRGQQQRVAKA